MPKIPGVNHLDAVRALEKVGFRILRQGKHIVMSDGVRILTIPRHNPVNASETPEALASFSPGQRPGDLWVMGRRTLKEFVSLNPRHTARRIQFRKL